MRHLIRNVIFSFALLVIAIGSVNPFQGLGNLNLRLGKDLSGGITLVYAVQVNPGENPQDVISKTIEILERRIDPNGLLEVQMVAQGTDRIEVTMPLASDSVIELRDAYRDSVAALAGDSITAGQIEETVRAIALLTDDEQQAVLASLAGGDDAALAGLQEANLAYADLLAAAAALENAEARDLPDEMRVGLEIAVVDAEREFERARDAAVIEGLTEDEFLAAIGLPDEKEVLRDERTGELQDEDELESPRERAIARLIEIHPAQAESIDAAVAALKTYEDNRTGLDDQADLRRLIAAAGVPSFRITVDPAGSTNGNSHPEEQRLREEIRERGPQNVNAQDAVWCRINDPANDYETVQQRDALEADPAGYYAARGYVVESWGGAYWMLCWDAPGLKLTQSDGAWSIARAYRTRDQIGRNAVGFSMDATGAVLLGRMTATNINNNMAVLLDEEVYTAPNLEGNISDRGIITGSFSEEEIDYIINVLRAGALSARVDPTPISVNEIAPSFGQDNLEAGTIAGIFALAAVSLFMLFYYFAFGMVAVFSLLFNAALILGAMALARAAFSLPGIAGVILTFGMAVDANVLIYERIREEMRKGEDLRTSVRLGYQKALSAIVDGNVTNLIVCFILGYLGTQEIKGFAITLGIGVVCTLFSALVVSRIFLTLATDVFKFKKLGMLPTYVAPLERALEPKINWMGLRWVFVAISTAAVSLGIGMVIYQGDEMLDTEFRGGTQVTLTYREFKPELDVIQPEDGSRDLIAEAIARLEPGQELTPESFDPNDLRYVFDEERRLVLTRQAVQDRLDTYIETQGLQPDDELFDLAQASVIPVNPEEDNVSSSTFSLKTYIPTDDAVLRAVTSAFQNELNVEPALDFAGRDLIVDELVANGIYEVLSDDLGEILGRPGVRQRLDNAIGGVVILLEDIRNTGASASGASEFQSVSDIETRLLQTRQDAAFDDISNRRPQVFVIDGTPDAVRTAAVLISDPNITLATTNYSERWRTELAEREWALVLQALTQPTTFASVQTFSPIIAETFQQTAIIAVFLSFMLILIYIWVRFGSVRYSLAAITTLTHDVLFAIGLIALAEILYKNEQTAALAAGLLVEPFKIDLTLVAAILTIIGYSLNDTIIIMDRIRENRGRLPYATKQIVNDSINQTISRTVITSGTTLIATLILYTNGGAGVHSFAYALLIGVLIGTYSSIAVAAPMVWSRRSDGGQVVEPERKGYRLP